ncbi:MAG: VOC family protein [Candidatus Aminicenantes bacterium]|nr:VOC family protein [Candidatus Aminicenantes bacterium]
MKIDFITVYTIDIDKTIGFYQRVLDFKVVRRFTPGTGMEIVFMDDQHGHQIEFIKDIKELPYSGSGLSLGFYVKDIKQTAAHLESHGVEILFGPFAMPSGVKLLHARDNNALELGFVEQPAK